MGVGSTRQLLAIRQGRRMIQPLRAFRRAKMSKLDLGTIENGSAACDLPPEGPKKKSWADLTHLAHLADLADLAKISAQKCKKSVPGEGAPT